MPRPVETTPPPPVAVATPPGAPEANATTSAPAATITATPASGGDHTNLRPVAYGVGIGAAVALVVGAVEGVVAIKKRNEFNNHLGPDPNDPFNGGVQITDCNTMSPTPACKDIQDSWSRARTLSIVGFVAGGALAAGTAVLWVISAPKEHGGTALACAPDIGSRGFGCRLQF
jgi:hypothetical protein